jgi:hypothetical protein
MRAPAPDAEDGIEIPNDPSNGAEVSFYCAATRVCAESGTSGVPVGWQNP